MAYVTSSTTIPAEMHEDIKNKGLKVSYLVRVGYDYQMGKTEVHEQIKALKEEVSKRDDMLIIWKKKVNRLENQVYGGGDGETDEHGRVLRGRESDAKGPDSGPSV